MGKMNAFQMAYNINVAKVIISNYSKYKQVKMPSKGQIKSTVILMILSVYLPRIFLIALRTSENRF